MEPRLIAVEYIFDYYFYYIDALASLDLKVQVSESLMFFGFPVNQVKQVMQVLQVKQIMQVMQLMQVIRVMQVMQVLQVMHVMQVINNNQ